MCITLFVSAYDILLPSFVVTSVGVVEGVVVPFVFSVEVWSASYYLYSLCDLSKCTVSSVR